jgi:hypothetical protein
MRSIRYAVVLLSLVLAWPAAAQEADILTGRVTGADGRPIVGARVEVVSAETEITRSVLTDQNGRYLLQFPDGGGRYLVRITYIGLGDIVQAVVRNAEEELLLTDFVMSAQAITLDAINVSARRPAPSVTGAGEQSTALTQDMVNRLPLPDLDPGTLALLTAGVVGTSADSLSGAMGFSVAGMSDLLNQITLDGVIMGDGSLGVPEEGVRRTQVTTSTFDASRGGFAGGQVSMSTARGSNRPGGALSYRLDDDALQMSSSASTHPFTRHNLGGSWGGPILRNRLFYNGSFQLGRNTNYLFALAANDPLAAQRSGVTPDSIGRFLDILQDGYDFPIAGQTGAYTQLNRDYRMQGRMDWNAMQRQGQSHTVSLSGNTNINRQDSTRIRSLDLAQHGGDVERNSQLLRLGIISRFGTTWTNSLTFSFSENWSAQLPFVELPEGQVRVTSEFDDGTRGTSSLVFGGNRSMPQDAYSRNLQAANDVSFLRPVGGQLHRLKLGGSIDLSRNINRSTDNLFGTFTFASLEDFEANRPERFDRSLTERRTRTGSLNAGLYVGDTWRVSMPLEITLGLRWDYSRLDQRPDYNPAVEAAFGRRTDITPDAMGISPRIGFNYRLNAQGEAPKSLSGGIGLFAGRSPLNIYSTAVRQTGLPNAEQRLSCIGAATPAPDWDLYLQDPTAVPDACADGTTGGDLFSLRAPTVTLIDPDQSLPSSLRLDVGYRTQLPKNFTGNFRYTYSLGRGLWGYRDINLDETNSFELGGEGRRFFGDRSAIVTESGAVSYAAARINPEFGSVFDVVSGRASQAHQVTAQIMGQLPPKLFLSLNYTLGFARDQASGSFAQATTADNPNEVEWATSNNDRRHTINLMTSYAVKEWIELSATSRLSSGTPFTPLVNRDINGDGARNDRAWVFDPATVGDTAMANGMTRLLSNAPGSIADCLRSQLGRIADRNSCRNAWTESLDMRLSLRPHLPTLQRRLTLSLDTRNMLTGIDQLVNGKNGMKGWGAGQRADATLLEVNGFDPTTSSFIYEVNEAFGQTRRGPSSFRTPFSITLSGRIAIGGQQQMNNRGFGTRGFGGGFPGGFGGGPGGGGRMIGGPAGAGGMDMIALMRGTANVDSILAAVLTNPVRQVLELRDTIELTAGQVTAVQLISDTLDVQLARRHTELEPALQLIMSSAGGAPNPQQIRQQVQLQIQPHVSGAQREAAEAMAQVERELGEAQWQKLPESLRRAAQQPERGGFNAVGFLDRMLVNPLPVLLELKDTLQMTTEQIALIETLSADLQVLLARRREDLGRRFDNVQAGAEQGRIFQELQPEIERARTEIGDALKAAERVLTPDQWKQVPEQVRNPFQPQRVQRRGGRE